MKKILTLLAGLLLGAAFAGPALADRHVRLGVSIGVPLGAPYYDPYYYPYYYPDPYYYPPRVVVVPQSPPTYVERDDPQEQEAPASAYWYYCQDAKAYYPYVKQCPGGWQRVSPTPPPQ
jgi:hypothetical protein